jgi:hypothetical protein
MKTVISRIVTGFAIVATGLMLLGARCFYEPEERVNPLDPRNVDGNNRPQMEAILFDTIVDTGLAKMVKLNWAIIDHWHVTGYNLYRYLEVETCWVCDTCDPVDIICDSFFRFECIASKNPDESTFTDTLADPIMPHYFFMTAVLDYGADSLVSDTVRNPSSLLEDE